MPSTAVISLLFMALTLSPDAAVQGATAAPAALGLNCVFLGVCGRLARAGWGVAMAAGLLAWALLAAAWWAFAPRDLASSLLTLAAGFGVGMTMTRSLSGDDARAPGQPGGRITAARALLGGAVVSATVLVSYWGGDFAGGLAAAFPAVAAATMAIVGWSSGPKTACAMLCPVVLANALTIAPYLLVVRATYGTIGVAPGTLLALAVSAFCAWGLYTVTRRCQRKAE
ncbi:MAG: hypothetical protein FGM15_10560 [Chthoniobacterales bacterium]|nr:hypothetical protein [Chthoniobacterales bacterium]